MSDLKIEDATPDTDVQGGELIPVSDGGAPKCVSVEQVKEFVIGAIEALAATTSLSQTADGVFVKRGGKMKPVSVGTLAGAVFGVLFGKSDLSSLARSDKFLVSTSGGARTVTLGAISDFVKAVASAAAFNIQDLDVAASVESGMYIPVKTANDSVNKKVEVNVLKDFILPLHVSAKSFGKYDRIPVLHNQGGISGFDMLLKEELPFGDGDVKGPGATVTAGEIAQFDGTTGKKIKGGKTVVESVGSSSAASHAQIPTAKAVRSLFDGLGAVVTAGGTPTLGSVPTWFGGKTLSPGVAFETTIAGTYSGSDVGGITTGKAVADYVASFISQALATSDDGTYGTIMTAIISAISTSIASGDIKTALASKAGVSNSTTRGNIATWGASNGVLDGTGMACTSAVSGSSTDSQIPTAKAVHNAVIGRLKVTSAAPYGNATGYPKGALVFMNATSGSYLYLNIGDETAANWVRFKPAE